MTTGEKEWIATIGMFLDLEFNTMATNIHKVFVSYHHTTPDQQYRDAFEKLFAVQHEIMVSQSVQIGDINLLFNADRVRQKIRDEYIRDATVTVVLIGKLTWQRKHVDWEISSSIRDTALNPRCGLLGIFLPSYPLTPPNNFNHKTIPPRLYDNWKNDKNRFAHLYNWSTDPMLVQSWIHKAFQERNTIIPDNSFDHFGQNRTANEW